MAEWVGSGQWSEWLNGQVNDGLRTLDSIALPEYSPGGAYAIAEAPEATEDTGTTEFEDAKVI